MKSENLSEVEEIFAKALTPCLNVDLWKVYLSYIERFKPEQIGEAYEFAIQQIGLDIGSTPIWMDYLNYLKKEEVGTMR